MIFDVVNCSIRQLLNPELTASWEKGTHLCGRGKYYGTGIYGQAGTFCAGTYQQVEDSNYQYNLRQFFDRGAVIQEAGAASNGRKKSSFIRFI